MDECIRELKRRDCGEKEEEGGNRVNKLWRMGGQIWCGRMKFCLSCHPGIFANYFAWRCVIYQFILWLMFVPDTGMFILSKDLCSFGYDISLHFVTMCIVSDKYFIWIFCVIQDGKINIPPCMTYRLTTIEQFTVTLLEGTIDRESVLRGTEKPELWTLA